MHSGEESRRVRRLIAYGFSGMLILIGVAAVLSVLFRGPSTQPAPFFPFFRFGFGWVSAIIGIFVFFWIIRWLFWPWGRRYPDRHWGYGHDEAIYILTQRYAKGEITKEQFEQMTRDLEQHS